MPLYFNLCFLLGLCLAYFFGYFCANHNQTLSNHEDNSNAAV